MHVQRVALIPLLLAAASCGDDKRAPVDPNLLLGCTGCVDGGGAGSMGGSSGAGGSLDAGVGGAAGVDSGGNGQAGVLLPAPDPVCGNGVVETGEQCDTTDFDELSCASFGFSDGQLSCSEDCTPDSSACSGVEVCSDGADNDGDGSVDCSDEDCALSCQNFCVAPAVLQNAFLTRGTVAGHLSPEDSSCALEPDESGQVVFSYVPPLTGVADLYLIGNSGSLALSARTECADVGSELSCEQPGFGGGDSALRIAVTQGDAVFVVVESLDRSVPSTFELVANAREVACGDGYIDLGEVCDDGNQNDSDGCNNQCQFQSSEQGANGSIGSADPYEPPAFFGEISSAEDRDIVFVDVPAGHMLVAEIFDMGDNACGNEELDSYLELFDDQGELLTDDDDGGNGFCSALVAEGLSEGQYFVQVTAAGGSQGFLYELGISLYAP